MNSSEMISYPIPGPGSEASPPVPAYTLFNAQSVALATFLGAPIAGSILMAVNYRRLGKGGLAAAALVVGLILTASAIGLGFVIQQDITLPIGLALVIGARHAAKALQGADVEQHVLQGGKLGSKWAAAGLGLVFLVTTVLCLAYYFYGNPKVTIGKDEIYYSGSATKEDAQALGDKLKTTGFLSGRGVSVMLSKGTEGTVVSFVVEDGIWNEPKWVASFEEVGRQIAPTVGGFPIQVRLLNSYKTVEKQMTVGKAVIGTKDEIYYFGTATDAEAKALGQALQTVGYLKDSGVSVLLSKNDGTAISFVVKDGFWDDPEHVAAFEKIVRQVAPSVGGLPVKLRLLNNTLETKKETAVQ